MNLVQLRAYWRFVVVAWHFLPLGLAYLRDRRRYLVVGGRRRVAPEVHRRRAERLLEALLTLGPTFIKLGQLLSTRPDVLPPAYVDELARLQDRVPPAPWSATRPVVESALGPIEERFSDFEEEAISGASLGQVYRARVDGRAVAVKVRRPGIETLVEADLRVIRFSLPIVMRFVGENRAFSLETLADEFARTIRQEMDYVREAAMLREIRANFADDDRVRMPAVVDSHSTGRVLTMEYVEGTKITDLEGLDALGVDRHRLADTLERAYLQMIIDDGVFHADPHPGNLAVRPDGTIVFYDFGMSGRVDPVLRSRIVDFYVAIANHDIDAILDALIEMGTLSPRADRAVMGEIMELAIEDARGRQIERYRIQQIIEQIEDTIYEFPLRLPSNLALVLRVATVVEGVCVTLDPDFDFIETATAYLTERGYREATARQAVSAAAEELRGSAASMVRVPPKLERALDDLDRGTTSVETALADPDRLFDRLARRLAYATLLASVVVASAIVYGLRGPDVGLAVGALAALVLLALLYRSLRGRRGIRARPQFTRQSMRRRGTAATEPGGAGDADRAAVRAEQDGSAEKGDPDGEN